MKKSNFRRSKNEEVGESKKMPVKIGSSGNQKRKIIQDEKKKSNLFSDSDDNNSDNNSNREMNLRPSQVSFTSKKSPEKEKNSPPSSKILSKDVYEPKYEVKV